MDSQTRATPSAAQTWTMGRMAFQLPPALERYILAHGVGYGASGAALVQDTEALGDPAVMMLAKEEYAVLRFLAGLLGCRRALDVGTFTGLSALAFADGMGAGGRVVTIDREVAWRPIAERHWRSAGVLDRIDLRNGEATDVLAELARDPNVKFDIAFIDVDKARIQAYVDVTMAMLAPGGLVIVDNTIWHGWVLDPARLDADTDGMRNFNTRIRADPRLEVALLPIGDGLTFIRRLR